MPVNINTNEENSSNDIDEGMLDIATIDTEEDIVYDDSDIPSDNSSSLSISTNDISNVSYVESNVAVDDYSVSTGDVTESPKNQIILGSTFNSVESSFDFVTSSLMSTYAESQRAASFLASLGQLKSLTALQNKSIVNSINVNDPLVLDSEKLSICYQDIYGNSNYDEAYLFANESDGTFFALAYKPCQSTISYHPIPEHYDIFKLDVRIEPSTYYVYEFNDIINSQTTYCKYDGEIEMVGGVPYGKKVPYYENLVETTIIKPESVQIASYSAVCRNWENGDNRVYVLKEFYVPTIKINASGILEFTGSLELPGSYSVNSDNRICYIYEGNSGEIPTANDAKDYFYNLISCYSLNSPLRYVVECNGKDSYLLIKAHCLFVPVQLYTYANNDLTKYDYVPYEIIDNTSQHIVQCTINKDNYNDNYLLKFSLRHTDESTTVTAKKGDARWEIYDNDVEIFPTKFNGVDFFPLSLNDNSGISMYFALSSIVQDSEFNYVECTEAFMSGNLEDTIVTILSIVGANSYFNKITFKLDGNAYSGLATLYSNQEVKINNVYEKQCENFTYVKFIQEMSSTYKVEYISSIDTFSSYSFDPNVSSIKYKKAPLYERVGIKSTYVYYSPKSQSYSIYNGATIKYRGNLYGSSLFSLQQKCSEGLVESSADYINNHSSYEFALIDVYKRTKINPDSGISLSTAPSYAYFISSNVESKVNTYAIEPLVLANDFKYTFKDYSFVQPTTSYVINREKVFSGIPINNIVAYYVTSTYSDSIDDLKACTIFTQYSHSDSDEFSYIEISINNTAENLPIPAPQLSASTFNDFIKFYNKTSESNIKNDEELNKIFSGSYCYLCYKDANKTLYVHNQFNIKNEDDMWSCIASYVPSNTSSGRPTYCYLVKDANSVYEVQCTAQKKSYIVYTEIGKAYLGNTYAQYSFVEDERKPRGVLMDGYLTLNDESTTDIAYSYAIPICIVELSGENQYTYQYSEIITRDGYWKKNFTKDINPFVTVTYSYSSNSLDISNAYIVPTTKNERLGFVHKNRVAYNKIVDNLIEEYKYTYYNEDNVQVIFNEDSTHSIVNVGDDKYFGFTTTYAEMQLYSSAFFVENESKTTITISLNVDAIKKIADKTYNEFYNKIVNDDKTSLTLQKKSGGNYYYQIPKENEDTTDSSLTYYEATYDENGFPAIYVVDENSNPDSKKQNLLTYTIITNDIVEVHKRMVVSRAQEVKEFVIQEESLEPQYAQIDTPFGLVNGKKVIVMDQVYVPETYTTITTIDKDTYECTTKRVLLNDAYMSYTYEVEDIPFITASYIFDGGEGIKIQGMNELINALGGTSSQTILPTSSSPSAVSTSAYNDAANRSIASMPAYLANIKSSLVYINEAIDRNTKNIGYAISCMTDDPSYITNAALMISSSLNSFASTSASSQSTNVSNTINAQKSMVSKISESINNQTSTLSKLMMLSMIGQSGAYSYSTASLFTNVLSSMASSMPNNWQSVSKIGYQTTIKEEVASYKSIGYKHTKVIGKDQRVSGTKETTVTCKYDSPAYVSFAYSSAFESNSSTVERIGLHLSKESRDFASNGYVYHEDYYTYQNIADILADLHVSQRAPTRKEFIIDVSKRLYINSDFIFSYTSPNEYAIRAIRRADILWSELVNANVVEPEEASYRPLPQIPSSNSFWWNDNTKISYFAYALNLDLNKFVRADESTFIAIDSIIGSRTGGNSMTKSDEELVSSISYSVDKKDSLSYIWGLHPDTIDDSMLLEINGIVKEFQSDDSPSNSTLPTGVEITFIGNAPQVSKRPPVPIQKAPPVQNS